MMFKGDRLKKIRQTQKLSQELLAEKLNVHVNTIRRWEQDKQTPDARKLDFLAEVLGVSVAALMGENNDDTMSGSSLVGYPNHESLSESIPDPSFFVKEKDLIGNGKVLLYEGNGQRFILPATQENQAWFRTLMAGAVTKASVAAAI